MIFLSDFLNIFHISRIEWWWRFSVLTFPKYIYRYEQLNREFITFYLLTSIRNSPILAIDFLQLNWNGLNNFHSIHSLINILLHFNFMDTFFGCLNNWCWMFALFQTQIIKLSNEQTESSKEDYVRVFFLHSFPVLVYLFVSLYSFQILFSSFVVFNSLPRLLCYCIRELCYRLLYFVCSLGECRTRWYQERHFTDANNNNISG